MRRAELLRLLEALVALEDAATRHEVRRMRREFAAAVRLVLRALDGQEAP